MAKPSSLKHVPLDRFADGEGVPFSLTPHTRANYLSSKYPSWAIEAISSIGVTTLSPQEFLSDLNSAITQDPVTFRGKPASWHSELAEALLKLASDAELMSMIEEICLIPLHDGSWTSAKGQSMFFSRNETSLEIPSGIEVLIVDSAAESDPNRHKLFTTIGVKAWEASEICRLVLKVHGSLNFDPKALTTDQLISHAAFLYKASWQPPKTADLWFATMKDERERGRKLYMLGSVESDSAAARIFAQLQKQFPVVHNNYGKRFPRDTEWPIWLINNLGVSKIPRLITPFVEPKPQPTQTLKGHEHANAIPVLSEAIVRDLHSTDLANMAEENRKVTEEHIEEEDLIDYSDEELQGESFGWLKASQPDDAAPRKPYLDFSDQELQPNEILVQPDSFIIEVIKAPARASRPKNELPSTLTQKLEYGLGLTTLPSVSNRLGDITRLAEVDSDGGDSALSQCPPARPPPKSPNDAFRRELPSPGRGRFYLQANARSK